MPKTGQTTKSARESGRLNNLIRRNRRLIRKHDKARTGEARPNQGLRRAQAAERRRAAGATKTTPKKKTGIKLKMSKSLKKR